MRRVRCLTVLTLAILAHGGDLPCRGQGPLAGFRLFRRVEADPQNSYPLANQNGPWMIMAATFGAREGQTDAETQQMREEAAAQARDLVHELRQEYKLEAYTYVRRVDLNDETVQGRGIDRRGRPLRMRYQRKPMIEEVAVLIGNYPSIDSADAERDLKVVKDITPKALDVVALGAAGRRTYQQLAGLAQKTVTPEQFALNNPASWLKSATNLQINNVTRQFGPMGSAFVTRNPRLPKEDPTVRQVDQIVYDMNKDVRFSLLECPKNYTVQVATFTGAVVVDQKKIRELERGEAQLPSRLTEAAIKAHELTEALRLKGFEAYEFHDRGASIVTVGSFDSVGVPRPDGKIELNPAVLKTIQTFGVQPNGQPMSLLKIPFDVQPLPVAVPRRSIAADYAGTAGLGLFGAAGGQR